MDKFKMIAAGYVFFIRDNQVLMLRRCNTGYMDGYYSLPAGHIEDNEPIREGTCREMKEETGVDFRPDELKPVHVMHRKGTDIRIDFFFSVDSWSTEPKNTEPDKCDDFRWFPLDDLPENTIPYIKTATQHLQNNVFYSEFGWE
jgi:ADP-ribose pyrophosphatase YjhB (NUDIX family)